MSCSIKLGAIVFTSLALVILLWACADGIVYEHKIRTFVLAVEGASIGTPEADVQWIRTKYSDRTSDEYSPSYYELSEPRSGLELCLKPTLCFIPRHLMMQRPAAYATISIRDGHIVRKNLSIGIDLLGKERGGLGIEEGVNMRPWSRGAANGLAKDPNFSVLLDRHLMIINVVPGASEEERQSAYIINFRCFWRLYACKDGSDLTPAAFAWQSRIDQAPTPPNRNNLLYANVRDYLWVGIVTVSPRPAMRGSSETIQLQFEKSDPLLRGELEKSFLAIKAAAASPKDRRAHYFVVFGDLGLDLPRPVPILEVSPEEVLFIRERAAAEKSRAADD